MLYYGPEEHGFRELQSLAMDRTGLKDWSSIVRMNAFPKLEHLRLLGTPLHSSMTQTECRTNCIARIAKLESINGSVLKETERRDSEIVYVRESYEKFLAESKADPRTMTIEDPKLVEYMVLENPRWFALAEQYGNPIEMIREMQDLANTSLSKQSAKVELVGPGRAVSKKLLVVMTVKALRAMCGKLFKAPDVSEVVLVYEVEDFSYVLEEDMRQLSFYGVADGGRIKVMF